MVLYRSCRTLDVSVWQDLREAGQAPIVDKEPLPPEKPEYATEFPTLTPAGLEPKTDFAPEPGPDIAQEATRA